mgnify:CR=1 FL=1
MTPRQALSLALLRAMPRRPRKRRLPRQIPAKLIEAEYARAVVALVMPPLRRALAPLLEALPHLLASAADARQDVEIVNGADAPRHDAGEGRRVHEMVAVAQDVLDGAITQEGIERLAAEFARKTSTYQRVQIARQTRAALGTDVLVTDRAVAPLVEGFVAENVALIKDVPAKILGQVEQAVTRGVANAALHKDLAVEIRGIMRIGEKRARFIARDQVGKFYGVVNDARIRSMGVDEFEWATSHDERVRPAHRALDGRRFKVGIGHETEGIPGAAILCRCHEIPVFDSLLAELDKL